MISKKYLRILFLIFISAVSLASVILPTATRPSAYALTIGEVSTQDISAPRDNTYISEVLTERARKDAENSVAPVYLAPDPGITRNQLERLGLALKYMDTVRADNFSTPGQKIQDLQVMNDLQLNESIAEKIITMTDSRWETIKFESLQVLEQVMRSSIREYQLRDVVRNIPSLISFSLTQEQASIVTELANPFVVPTSILSEEQTQILKEHARAAIQPVVRTYVAGQTIVDRGQIVTEAQIEALDEYGLIQNSLQSEKIISAATLIVLMSSFILLYSVRRQNPIIQDWRALIMISLLFIVFLISARFIIPNRTVIPYTFPIPAFALIVASLFNLEISLLLSLPLSLLASYDLPFSPELTLFYIVGSVFGAVVLGRGRRVSIFFMTGAVISLTSGAVLFAFRIGSTYTDLIGIATLLGAAVFNGFASISLALILQAIIAQLLGITTAIQLLEISRPDHPLLQHFLRNAPGSYQHSLQVANLAEQAARAIGADPLMVRVGAIYHDVGKSANPNYFIENQVPGSENPHDDLDPHTSSKWIISHVQEGVQLAKKYQIPPRIRDFMLEHHGTMYTRYQYAKALEAAGNDADEIDMDNFRYPGPKPQTRETALLMLADGCEAVVRAELPRGENELRILIQKVFDFCLKEGQLDHTDFTLRDLTLAAEAFARTLKNTHHLRIKYPDIKTIKDGKKELQSSTSNPAAQPISIQTEEND